MRRQWRGLQRRNGRSVQHLAVRRKLRAVAGAIPALLRRIPMHMAAEMGADRRPRMQLAVAIAAHRDPAHAVANNAAFPRLELADAVELARHQMLSLLHISEPTRL